ncbi:MAG: T9SS type A sorting domain-containing protein [Brumimicrobium sp.]|nr:T9SS type A sorting domain-containing protein [Brumimicrobium sp.]
MKATLLINVFAFLSVIQINTLYGQQNEDPCTNEVSTNHENPTNSNLPNEIEPGYDIRFLNSFNWIPFNSAGNLEDLQTVGLSHLGNSQYMFPLMGSVPTGFSGYYDYLNNEVVMPENGQGGFLPSHQNGWELIAVNLGFFPDGSPYTDVPGASNKHPRIPYVILYHRYLEKIRVFANIGDEWAANNAYDAVRIRLTLNGENKYEKNGLFRMHQGYDQALDQTTDMVSVGAIAEAPNDKQRWFSADFTVSHDPCVCNFASAINLDFELVKNIDLKLYGRQISMEEPIVDANGNLVNQDFFSGFSVDQFDSEVNEGGFIMYKKMEDLFDDYISRMEDYQAELAIVQQYNEQIDKNLAIVKWVKHALDVGITAATGGSPISVALTNSLLQHASGVVGTNVTASELSERWEKVFKAAEGILGKEISTFVNNNFKKKDPPTIPEKPTVTLSEMYFKGRLTQVDPKPGPTIYTPGTYGNSITEDLPDQHYYPVYNDPLGVFALLKSPKIKVSETLEYEGCELVVVPTGTGEDYFVAEKYSRITQFKLNEKLSYTFNNALDIKKSSIQASIVIDGKMANELASVCPSCTYTNEPVLNQPKYNVNIESITHNVDEVEELDETTRATQHQELDNISFSSIYVPINALINTVGSFGTLHEDITLTLGSEEAFDPVICDQDHLESNENADEDENKLIIDNIYLKLLINVTYEGEKSDGTPHEYTYMLTYKVHPDDISYVDENPLYPNLSGSPGDITQYPENLFLSGANFDGSPVEGCILDGNTYTCKAWNDITVEGDFTVANGFEVKVEAGNEVTITPESTTPPEMQFSIVPVLDYSNPMPPQTDTEVKAFCNDNNSYQANISTKSMKNKNSESENEKSLSVSNEQTEFLFNLYPNPTNGGANAVIALKEATDARLIVTDLSGKVLMDILNGDRLNAGENQLTLDTQILARGIYLVHLTVNGERYVKRLVKQ